MFNYPILQIIIIHLLNQEKINKLLFLFKSDATAQFFYSQIILRATLLFTGENMYMLLMTHFQAFLTYNSGFERPGIHPKEHKALTHGQEVEFPLSKIVVQDNPSSTCTHFFNKSHFCGIPQKESQLCLKPNPNIKAITKFLLENNW